MMADTCRCPNCRVLTAPVPISVWVWGYGLTKRALAGAVIGTFAFPIVGTAIGAVVGVSLTIAKYAGKVRCQHCYREFRLPVPITGRGVV